MASKILVADDSITIQKIVAMAFESEDAQVEGVGNGDDAFDKLAEFRPDIVLADIDMPGLSGFDLSRKIKESEEFQATKVLLLASDFEDFDERLFMNSHADDHISKPFKSDDIVNKVKELLGMAPAPVISDDNDTVIALTEDDLLNESEEAEANDRARELLDELTSFDESYLEKSGEGLGDDWEQDRVIDLSDEGLIAPGSDDFLPLDSPETLSEDDGISRFTGVELDIEPEETLAQNFSAHKGPGETEPGENLDALLKSVEQISGRPVGLPDAQAQKKPSVTDVIDDMVNDMESLRKQKPPRANEGSGADWGDKAPVSGSAPSESQDDLDLIADVDASKRDSVEELNAVFKEIAQKKDFGPLEVPPMEQEPAGDFDLMGTPNQKQEDPAETEETSISESVAYLSDLSSQAKKEKAEAAHDQEPLETYANKMLSDEEQFSQVVGEHVRRILEKSLATSIENEVAGLSEVIVQIVREVLKEITPDIAREIVKEEIEKITNVEKV